MTTGPTNIDVTSPQGTTSRSATYNNVVAWDASATIPLSLRGQPSLVLSDDHLGIGSTFTVSGQGTSVPDKFSRAQGSVYWEATWTELSNTNLAGGIGLIDAQVVVSSRTEAQLAQTYAAIAADGTNGLIFRPGGTVYETVPNGNGVGPESPPWPLFWNTDDGIVPKACQEGDTIGMIVDFDGFAPTWLKVTIVGVSGSILGISASTFFPKWGVYVPCVVYGTPSVSDVFAVTANFGADPATLLGPNVLSSTIFDGVTLGWPA